MRQVDIIDLCENGFYLGVKLKGSLIHTHISWVILSDQFAFKIKRPISLGFLDFSDLEKRKFFCERELLLNSRFSDIYLDVLPVYQLKDAWVIGGSEGRLCDYVVRMKRMDNAKEMDKLLLKDQVTREDIEHLAEKIAEFHKGAEIISAPFDLELAKNSFNGILIVQGWLEDNLGNSYQQLVKELIDYSNLFLERNASLFQRRIDSGFKRNLHGDLHSKNIFLYKEPVLFDCIEFNDAFREIDLLSELAFLCMDLEAYGKKGLSLLFLAHYLNQIPCLRGRDDWKIFHYYKVYRASVRVMVCALQAQEQGSSKGLKNEILRYLKLLQLYSRNHNHNYKH